ncbi:hypothetical protein GGF38_000977, partial [Coemansia sp. RSA 25]
WSVRRSRYNQIRCAGSRLDYCPTAAEAIRLTTAAPQVLNDKMAAAKGANPELVPTVHPKPIHIAELPRKRPDLSNWVALPLLSLLLNEWPTCHDKRNGTYRFSTS